MILKIWDCSGGFDVRDLCCAMLVGLWAVLVGRELECAMWAPGANNYLLEFGIWDI